MYTKSSHSGVFYKNVSKKDFKNCNAVLVLVKFQDKSLKLNKEGPITAAFFYRYSVQHFEGLLWLLILMPIFFLADKKGINHKRKEKKYLNKFKINCLNNSQN